MMKNYTIDYEEYRNRSRAWCVTPNNPTWSLSWAINCSNVFTRYGNENSQYDNSPMNNPNNSHHKFFYCSSTVTADELWTIDYNVFKISDDPTTDPINYIGGCITEAKLEKAYPVFVQSYGQYESLFTDVKDDVDFITWAAHDDDDVVMWILGIPAIHNIDSPTEIYLISRDGKERLYIRRKLIEEWNYDGITGNNNDNERLYTIQILQLRWLDAGSNHDFDTAFPWVYDGQIDTRACDYGRWFVCNGANVGGAYSWYHLPLSWDDGRRDLLNHNVTISDWKITLWPLSDPSLSFTDSTAQTNPYIRVSLVSKLYGKNWRSKIDRTQMEEYTTTLQTTFSFLPR